MTATAVHLFTSDEQPLTDHVDTASGIRFTYSPRSRWRCHGCGRVRWAKNLAIRCYYDMSIIRCADAGECRAAAREKRKGRPPAGESGHELERRK